jgi:hypothetical protein
MNIIGTNDVVTLDETAQQDVLSQPSNIMQLRKISKAIFNDFQSLTVIFKICTKVLISVQIIIFIVSIISAPET